MKSLTAVVTATLLLAGTARAAEPKPAQPALPAPPAAAPAKLSGAELEKALYAVGLTVARMLTERQWSFEDLGR